MEFDISTSHCIRIYFCFMPSILRPVRVIIIVIIIITINKEWQGTGICEAYTAQNPPPQKREKMGVKKIQFYEGKLVSSCMWHIFGVFKKRDINLLFGALKRYSCPTFKEDYQTQATNQNTNPLPGNFRIQDMCFYDLHVICDLAWRFLLEWNSYRFLFLL